MSEAQKQRRPHRATTVSRIVAIVNDIHFELEHVEAWRCFREWHRSVKPWKTVFLGDFVDFSMLSRYLQSPNAEVHAIPQIKRFVREANELRRECSNLVVVEGNHDSRWSKAVLGQAPAALRGALGFTLKDQCIAHGLDTSTEWIVEDEKTRGLTVGQFCLRHGHNQSGRFGGGKHLAANRIAKSLGQSEVFAHHHRAQLFCQTAHGRTAIAIASPCMTRPNSYAPDADWQVGWSVLELSYPDYTHATPYIVLVENGKASWGGRTWGAK